MSRPGKETERARGRTRIPVLEERAEPGCKNKGRTWVQKRIQNRNRRPVLFGFNAKANGEESRRKEKRDRNRARGKARSETTGYGIRIMHVKKKENEAT